MARLESVNVSLKVPFTDIGIEGTWRPDDSERKAAWEMYVELVTRVAVVELRPEEGSLHEALSSLYTIFDATRTILRTYGPAVAQPKGQDALSFGYLAIFILNQVLRPVLTKWHTRLLDYENAKPASMSSWEHEMAWDKNKHLRDELNAIRAVLATYANTLAEVAGVPPLTERGAEAPH